MALPSSARLTVDLDALAHNYGVLRPQAPGAALRAALGRERPATIYVLDGMTAGTGPRLVAADLTPSLTSVPQVEAAGSFAATLGRALPVALHIDTGMN